MLRHIQVLVINTSSPRGWLRAGEYRVPCLIGKNGLTARKREGDGKTPMGSFRTLQLMLRRDRKTQALSTLPHRTIGPRDGWCEAAGHRNYNRLVRLPSQTAHDLLMREDAAYDYCIVLDCNIRPRVQGKGSAIFFHLIREGATVTAGCVAISRKHMEVILRHCGPKTRLRTDRTSVPRRATRK